MFFGTRFALPNCNKLQLFFFISCRLFLKRFEVVFKSFSLANLQTSLNYTNIFEFIFIQMDNFYKRLSQLSEYKGFKSVNKFALDGLNYSSSEKLNRLKKENTNPSVEILLDISNKFEEISIDWLLTGKGEMLRDEENEVLNSISEPKPIFNKNPSDYKEKLIATLENINLELRNDKIELQKDKELLAKIINNNFNK